MENLKQFIANKSFKLWAEDVNGCTSSELRERVEDCVFAYGSIITKDGKVLTKEEMENLNFNN